MVYNQCDVNVPQFYEKYNYHLQFLTNNKRWRFFVFLDAFSSLRWNNLLMGDKMEGHVSIPDRTSYSRSNRPFSHFQRRLGTMTSPISDVTLDVEARIEKKCLQSESTLVHTKRQTMPESDIKIHNKRKMGPFREVRCEVTSKRTISKNLSPRELRGQSAT